MKEDFLKYLSKRVRITLTNNYNFTGDVISVSEDSISLKDKFKQNLTIRLQDILFIIEVSL